MISFLPENTCFPAGRSRTRPTIPFRCYGQKPPTPKSIADWHRARMRELGEECKRRFSEKDVRSHVYADTSPEDAYWIGRSKEAEFAQAIIDAAVARAVGEDGDAQD